MAYLYLTHVLEVVVRRVHERCLRLHDDRLLYDGWQRVRLCNVSQIA